MAGFVEKTQRQVPAGDMRQLTEEARTQLMNLLELNRDMNHEWFGESSGPKSPIIDPTKTEYLKLINGEPMNEGDFYCTLARIYGNFTAGFVEAQRHLSKPEFVNIHTEIGHDCKKGEEHVDTLKNCATTLWKGTEAFMEKIKSGEFVITAPKVREIGE